MKKILFSLVLLALAFPALAQISETRTAQLKRGAQLYDSWYAFAEGQPEGTHPSYPAEGKRSGADTWRCKECHGWDYLGKDGRYSKGSHSTGIKGVFGARSWSHEGLEKLLGPDGRHDFTGVLGKDDIHALALFVREGLADVRLAIDGSGKGRGSAEAGAPLYAAQCAGCHGPEGTALDFKGSKEGVQGVGWLARDNPQETLHKILWGHPGSEMPSMWVDAGLSYPEVIDLLSYSQTLP